MKCQDGYTGSHMPTKSESQSGFLFIIKTPLTLTMIRTKCFMPHMLTLYRYGRSRPIDKYISGLPLFLIQTMIPRQSMRLIALMLYDCLNVAKLDCLSE